MNKKSKSNITKQDLSDSIKEHFNTGLKLSNGWRIGRFPRLDNEKRGSPQNSRTQIIIKKGNKQLEILQESNMFESYHIEDLKDYLIHKKGYHELRYTYTGDDIKLVKKSIEKIEN